MPNTDENLFASTDHYFYQFFTQITPGSIFAIQLMLLTVYTISHELYKLYNSGHALWSLKDEVPVQNIDTYFNVFKDKQLDSLIREEVVCKKRLDMQRLSERNFEKLVEAANSSEKRIGKPKMQGVHNYDILANDAYANRYLYTPCRFPNRSEYVISPHANKRMRKAQFDLVRLVCDLPYLSRKRA